MARDLAKLQHVLANSPIHLYFEKDKDGNDVLRHIRVNQRTIDVPADGITIDVIPPNSVGTREIEDESVMMDDLHPDVKNNMADRVSGEELEKFKV